MTVEVYKAIYVSAISLGLLTVLTLLASKKGEKRVDIAISILIVGLMSSPLNAYTSVILGKPVEFLLSLSQTITWLYGPLLFLILQYIQLKPVKFSVACLHFVPFVMVVVERQTGIVSEIIPSFVVAAFFLQISVYLIYSLASLYRHQKRVLCVLREYKNGTYYWLSYLVLGLLALTLWDASIVSVYLSKGTFNAQLISVIASGVGVLVCGIAFLIVYQPRLRSNSDDARFVKKTDKDAQDPLNDDFDRGRLRNIELTPSMVAELKENLEQLMESHKLHLDEEISLAKLSALLGVSRNQLSELFNVHLETSFYDYINRYRYKEAIKLLTDAECEITVSDIAYRSGFNNRNSFYRVFKQNMGLTPTEYRKSLGL